MLPPGTSVPNDGSFPGVPEEDSEVYYHSSILFLSLPDKLLDYQKQM